jgi:hypothetical protein
VRPTVRAKKASKSYSYSYSSSSQNKYDNFDAIPRLFWFRKDASLFEVFKQIML